ncbi:hypothetical protein NPIL_633741, partial [Nephila pilipes]
CEELSELSDIHDKPDDENFFPVVSFGLDIDVDIEESYYQNAFVALDSSQRKKRVSGRAT